jgi:hypothetical protein
MLMMLILLALVIMFIGAPMCTSFPPGSDQANVVEHRGTSADVTAVLHSIFNCMALCKYYFNMLLSRGATGADPAAAAAAKARAIGMVEQLTKLQQAGHLAQYGDTAAGKGSVAAAVAAATKTGTAHVARASGSLLAKAAAGIGQVASRVGLGGMGQALSGGISSLVGRIAELEGNNDSASAQDFCAHLAEVLGVALVTVFGSSISCDDFEVMPSVIRFGAVLVAVTFLALNYFASPDERISSVVGGTLNSLKNHKASTSAALALTVALRVMACSLGGGSE